MPRARHGGRRQGAPGQAYGNRTDLNQNRQPIRVASGQEYGARQAQVAAQKAVPLPAPPVPASPPAPAPGSFGAFLRPTENPNEPLTAGMDIGPGPGRNAIAAAPNPASDVEAQLLALYRQNPNNDILRLLRLTRQRDASATGAF
jgi:hypothetical protein